MDVRKTLFPRLVTVKKIWNSAEHNALTDLILFHRHWYCTFRESNKHEHGLDGQIRILKSDDANKWESVALIKEEGIDLRDPKFSITPDAQLMLLIGGTEYSVDQRYITRQPRVAFSKDGADWTPLQKVLEPHDWLWRITWHQGKGYGASYRYSNPDRKSDEWLIKLVSTNNGTDYSEITQWDIPGYPSEATVRFLPNDRMIALVRREQRFNNHAWIGSSLPSYINWEWNQAQRYFGGPNFIILPNGAWWAGGRIIFSTPYGILEKTVLASMTEQSLDPLIILPSGGDCSYPGMAYDHEFLWMSYYSSHEGKSAIYLAKIQFS